MGFYEFPHTRNYDADLGYLIHQYKALNNTFDEINGRYEDLQKKYELLLDIYAKVKGDIKSLTMDGLLELLENGQLEDMIKNAVGALQYQTESSWHLSGVEKQCLYNIMWSYVNGMWHSRNPEFEYNGNGYSALPLTEDGDYRPYSEECYKGIDCSTFVILCLMGIDFKHSPYYTKNYTSDDFDRLSVNGRLGLSRRFHPTLKNNIGLIRWAHEIGMYATENNMMVYIGDGHGGMDYSKIDTGDVLFWRYKDSAVALMDDDNWSKYVFKNIAHVGFAVKHTDSDAMAPEGFTDHSGITVIHCSTQGDVMSINGLDRLNWSMDVGQAQEIKKQELYPFVMRPKINVNQYHVKGLTVFRGLEDENVSVNLNHSAVTYYGTMIPLDALDRYHGSVNPSTGVYEANENRRSTYFIPIASPTRMPDGATGGLTNIGYYCHYYDRVGDSYVWQTVSNNRFDWQTAKNHDVMRISFYPRGQYSVWNDAVQRELEQGWYFYLHKRFEPMAHGANDTIAGIGSYDTLKFFPDATLITNVFVVGK